MATHLVGPALSPVSAGAGMEKELPLLASLGKTPTAKPGAYGAGQKRFPKPLELTSKNSYKN